MVVRVLPLPDTTSMRSNWQVKKDGVGQKSTHLKKSAAKKAARRVAKDGESRAIYNRKGEIIDWVKTRKG